MQNRHPGLLGYASIAAQVEILGSGKFVERIIKEAEAKIKYQLPIKGADHKIKKVIGRICKSENISTEELKAGSRRKEVSKARARIAIELVKKYGLTSAEVARQLGVTTSAISKIMKQAH